KGSPDRRENEFRGPRRRFGQLQAHAVNQSVGASLSTMKVSHSSNPTFRQPEPPTPRIHPDIVRLLGECKHIISGYLKCIKLNKGTNDEACRKLAKDYLTCRMDKNLMAPDNFKNLGLVFNEDQEKNQNPTADPTKGTEKNN
ncbi:hypothetical protein N7492_010234, partial [Penicillium capsulatum]